MTAVLWILQVLLAAVFLAAGGLKLVRPKEALLDKMGVLAAYHPLTIRAIGLAEVLGAAGLVVPPLVGMGGLVPWAALGLGSVMVAAAIAHGERDEWARVGVPLVLMVLAVVVMVGRSSDVPL